MKSNETMDNMQREEGIQDSLRRSFAHKTMLGYNWLRKPIINQIPIVHRYVTYEGYIEKHPQTEVTSEAFEKELCEARGILNAFGDCKKVVCDQLGFTYPLNQPWELYSRAELSEYKISHQELLKFSYACSSSDRLKRLNEGAAEEYFNMLCNLPDGPDRPMEYYKQLLKVMKKFIPKHIMFAEDCEPFIYGEVYGPEGLNCSLYLPIPELVRLFSTKMMSDWFDEETIKCLENAAAQANGLKLSLEARIEMKKKAAKAGAA